MHICQTCSQPLPENGVAEFAEALQEAIETAFDASEGRLGPRTGFCDLDALLHGLQPGQLIVVASRPGVGKSTLGRDFVRAVSLRQGKQALMFTPEEARGYVALRIAAAEAKLRITDILSGRLSDEGWTKLPVLLQQIQSAPIAIDDSPTPTLSQLQAQARTQATEGDLGLILVDTVQSVRTDARAESRHQEVAEVCRALKALARQLNVPVVALSHLSRGAEYRTGRRPQLTDLGESGAIEQHADTVVLIHRPDALEQDHPRMGEADLIVAKHRTGPIGTVTVAHQLHYCRFVSLAKD